MTAPMMALAVPLLDAGVAVVRRFLRHQPIFTADRNHIHHRLLARGLSPRQVALTIYGVCGLAAAFSLLQTIQQQGGFDGIVVILFCGAAALGIYFIGYTEFDTATRLIGSGTFRSVLNARLFADTAAMRFRTASTPEDYWHILRDVSRELKCVSVRASLWGGVFQETTDATFKGSCADLRIPLSAGYVNFRYPAELSVRHGVALSAMVDVLQRTLLAQAPLHLTSAAAAAPASVQPPTPSAAVPVTVTVSGVTKVVEVEVS
jgi:UDP-GlcNAc:undecaprenyl-phosphate GlcNAc-1-phosphate transferase